MPEVAAMSSKRTLPLGAAVKSNAKAVAVPIPKAHPRCAITPRVGYVVSVVPCFVTIVAIILCAWQPLFAQDSILVARNKAAHQALLDGRYDEAVKLYRDLVAAL